jgi:hypothetical protein
MTAAETWPEPPRRSTSICIEPLTRQLLQLDTAAYTSSPVNIARHSAGRWKVEGFTTAENLELLRHHEDEHAAGRAFAHALLTTQREREIGCVYLQRLSDFEARTGTAVAGLGQHGGTAAMVTFWLVDDADQRPPAEHVVAELEDWLKEWGAALPVFRCLPEETETVTALERRGLARLPVRSAGPLPYLWFSRR